MRARLLLVTLSIGLASGCAAVTNPVANGVPVRLLPRELHAETRQDRDTIPLSWLRHPNTKTYLLGPGDTLGVYIDGILGDRSQVPPVVVAEAANLPPAVGLPIPVREDGTVSLPLIEPLRVEGLTIEEAERRILDTYTQKQFVRADTERVFVTLFRPRHERVLVIREDSPRDSFQLLTSGKLNNLRGLGGVEASVTSQKQGTGTILELPVRENDVLNALLRTGGLPGPDAVDEVVIERNAFEVENANGRHFVGGKIVRIPIRVRRGEAVSIPREEVILRSGDIVHVRARQAEFFYTAGLLPARQVPLPRDYDLGVIEAVSQVGGPIANGGLNSSNLSGLIVAPGIGNPSPSLLTVLRRNPDGRRVNIRVDLNRALRDPRENILVQAGDVLILQETPGEALARYCSDVFSLSFLARIINRGDATGTTSVVLP